MAQDARCLLGILGQHNLRGLAARPASWLCVAALTTLVSCGPSPAAPQSGGTPGASAQPSHATLRMAVRAEPASLAPKPLATVGISVATTTRVFNAYLAYVDDHDTPHPYLAQALPKLNTDSWQVNPDGTMVTTWKLKPNLTWQDGSPLTADDFVFAYQVYTDPSFGTASSPPQSQMSAVDAPDPSTVVINWKQACPDAGVLWDNTGFGPLPRHILGSDFDQDDPATFANEAYWTNEYIGLGPYKLDEWQGGAYLAGSAFDGHVMGRPKIDRVELHIIPDPNTIVSSMLAGSIDIAVDDSLRFQQGQVLKQQWGTTGGTVLFNPNNLRYMQFQLRPELVSPRSLLDLPVRQALAYSLDKQALNEGLFEGEGMPADTPIEAQVPYFSSVESSITKYPHDPRQAEQLMANAGYTKGADGMYTSATGGRFTPDLQVIAQPQNQQEQAIIASTWQDAGIAATSSTLPIERQQDRQARSSFTGMADQSGNFPKVDGLVIMTSSQISMASNQWAGSNRGAWSDPDYDRLFATWSTTLDDAQRAQDVVQMTTILSQQLPIIPLFYNFEAEAHLATLTGPVPHTVDGTAAWNITDWQLH